MNKIPRTKAATKWNQHVKRAKKFERFRPTEAFTDVDRAVRYFWNNGRGGVPACGYSTIN